MLKITKIQIRKLFCICLLFFFGCKDKSTEPNINEPFERWKSFNLHDYTIDQTRMCFCPEAGEVMRITVRSDTIAAIYSVSQNAPIEFSISKYYRTVNSLFSLIQNIHRDSIVVTYNSVYGFPEMLDVYPQLHPVDGGVLFQTSNLQIPLKD